MRAGGGSGQRCRVTSPRLSALAASVLGLLLSVSAVTAPAQGAPAAFSYEFYSCMQVNASGQLVPVYFVKIVSPTTYQYSILRKGAKLLQPSTGKYVVKGERVSFKTGAMKTRYAELRGYTDGRPWFQIHLKKDGWDTSVSCYLQKKSWLT